MKHWMSLVVAAVVAVVTMLPMMTIEASAQRFFSPNGNFASNEQPRRLFTRNRARPQMGNPFARQVVKVQMEQPAGTIVVDTGNHFLYLMLGDGEAIRYGIGVARSGFEWAGTHRITNKREWPGWTPPAAMRKRVPGLPAYMPGGLDNPLGARALYIGSTLYRIHGTNEPWSIGQNVSSGCIRMLNDDVIDLYERVRVGARVIVR